MKLLKVRQSLRGNKLPDIRGAVIAELESLQLDVPAGELAITVGSRGIANIPVIIKATVDWLRDHGAKPFVVPSMGSHNGATAAGQRQMIESLGVTEAAVGAPIRASMECVKVGQVSTGDVWMDRFCYESEGVLVVNRIKLHTCFAGPVQSGLTKMMVVGMGKVQSATTFHSTPNHTMKSMLLEMGQCLLDSGKILAGLAILEDGHDQTAELHAVRGADILRREPELLKRHREYFPRLPIDDLNVLVVSSIGKTYSGSGLDTNVIGYRGVKGLDDLDKPDIKVIAALELAPASQGNAFGVGLADCITARLRSAIDEQKTFINVFTTGEMTRGKIPLTFSTDQELIEKIRERFGDHRWMFIANTLHLDQLYVSEDLRDEISQHPLCSIAPEAVELTFKHGVQQLQFGNGAV